MEDTLRDSENNVTRARLICLNPCFNGRYSQSKHEKETRKSNGMS